MVALMGSAWAAADVAPFPFTSFVIRDSDVVVVDDDDNHDGGDDMQTKQTITRKYQPLCFQLKMTIKNNSNNNVKLAVGRI